MCCLFGLMDYSGTLTAKQKVGALHTLATAAEARGTDATGIAYRSRGRLYVYKRPLPGHRMHFRLPQDTRVIMGHTRMTTQGSAKKNFNNHPFLARARGRAFALAHNGMIQNDLALQRKEQLPRTNIQTDSYVAVQLLEQSGDISSRTLGAMAEKLEGTFAFTVLDSQNNLYFIRGNNPLCIYHFPAQGLYLYASTREILDKAIERIPFRLTEKAVVDLTCGEILKIDARGGQSRSRFDDSRLWYSNYMSYSFCFDTSRSSGKRLLNPERASTSHTRALKSMAGAFGYAPWEIDRLLQEGFTEEEIEDYLYCGEL
ncbi:hypothetical protein DWX58_00930 [Pseudoflavonifractor sp. AF19-9AC]|uniref:class II glutamine amidotransferase n=1 Tax=Pseudoflavonifractor sp. AF19-9AC TaxID=2292244 RepID=UPI000E506008|nr:class II glutamine amidotransferase [Pseudoflavonifractor sp. AF19-9AC]RHR11058.1 hypothetical protein DWX58_00930 [Pseudoflavonifractor sp. AF19-9AC]